MNRLSIMLALLIFTLACSALWSETEWRERSEKDESSALLATGRDALPGYLLGIFLGFGTGHFYIESDGLPLLLTEVSGLALGVVGLALIPAALSSGDLVDALIVWPILSYLGFGIYGIARIVEIVGIFVETDKQRKAGVVASVEPIFEYRPDMAPSPSAGIMLRF